MPQQLDVVLGEVAGLLDCGSYKYEGFGQVEHVVQRALAGLEGRPCLGRGEALVERGHYIGI